MSLLNVVLSNEFVKQIEENALDAAKEILKEMSADVSKEVSDFILAAAPAISRYVTLLINKSISMDEFKDLMLGIARFAQMKSLTEAGFAAEKVDATRNAVLKTVTNLVVGSVSKLI